MDVLLNKEAVEVLEDGGATMSEYEVLDAFLYMSRGKTKERVVAASLEVMKACMSVSAVLWEKED